MRPVANTRVDQEEEVMKYYLKVYYRTDAMDQVTEYMRQIVDEWKQKNTRLEGCRIYEFETDEPLSSEAIEKLKALREDWMTEIVVEEVPA